MKKIIFALVFICFSLSSFAEKISPEQAQANARIFLLERGKKMLEVTDVAGSKTRAAEEEAPYYIFNVGDRDGFVIVSGDDRTVPILGYTDAGSFDEKNIPDGLRFMLGEYTRIIESIPADFRPAPAMKTRAPYGGVEYPVVEPLIKSKWGQGAPYNGQTPIVDGQRCPTGCVATAIAQIMNYWKYPEVLPELKGYFVDADFVCGVPAGVKYEVSNLSSQTFDWNVLKESYESEEEDENIALLMRYVGQAVKMTYSPSGSEAKFTKAIRERFGYNKYMRNYGKLDISTEEWYSLINTELIEKRPMYISGSNENCEGHAFVLDGSDGAGFYHINWGWSGYCDGYFLLDLLNPNYSYETNKNELGFCNGMSIVFGMKPEDILIDVMAKIRISYANNSIYAEFFGNLNGDENNELIFGNDYNLGIGCLKDDGSVIVLSNDNSIDLNYDIQKKKEILSKLGDGRYPLVALFRMNSKEDWTIISQKEEHAELIISGKEVSFGNSVIDGELQFDVKFVGDLIVGTNPIVEVTITNNSDKEFGINIGYDIVGVPSDPSVIDGTFFYEFHVNAGEKKAVKLNIHRCEEIGTYGLRLSYWFNTTSFDSKIFWKGTYTLANEKGEILEPCSEPFVRIKDNKILAISETPNSICKYGIKEISEGSRSYEGENISIKEIIGEFLSFEIVANAEGRPKSKKQNIYFTCSDFEIEEIDKDSTYFNLSIVENDILKFEFNQDISGLEVGVSPVYPNGFYNELWQKYDIPAGEYMPLEVKLPIFITISSNTGTILRKRLYLVPKNIQPLELGKECDKQMWKVVDSSREVDVDWVIDGNYNCSWGGSHLLNSNWITIDMGEEQQISAFNLAIGGNFAKELIIEASLDGVNFNEVYKNSSCQNISNTFYYFNLDKAVNMRYFKVILNDSKQNGKAAYPSISEISAFTKETYASKIELAHEELELHKKDKAQIEYKVLPEDAACKIVKWTSDDEKVATVDENGVVTAIGLGTATITATMIDDEEVSASCKVTVSQLTNIEQIDADELKDAAIYTLDGQRIETAGMVGKGMYIIRTKDGKAKKVVRK